jgi:hypothetical protein
MRLNQSVDITGGSKLGVPQGQNAYSMSNLHSPTNNKHSKAALNNSMGNAYGHGASKLGTHAHLQQAKTNINNQKIQSN